MYDRWSDKRSGRWDLPIWEAGGGGAGQGAWTGIKKYSYGQTIIASIAKKQFDTARQLQQRLDYSLQLGRSGRTYFDSLLLIVNSYIKV